MATTAKKVTVMATSLVVYSGGSSVLLPPHLKKKLRKKLNRIAQTSKISALIAIKEIIWIFGKVAITFQERFPCNVCGRGSESRSCS